MLWHHETEAWGPRHQIETEYRALSVVNQREGLARYQLAIAVDTLEVHGDRAYLLATFEGTLHYEDATTGASARRRRFGRLTQFWVVEDGEWRVRRLMIGRERPDGPLEWISRGAAPGSGEPER